jgi:hypothetical protein
VSRGRGEGSVSPLPARETREKKHVKATEARRPEGLPSVL